MRFETFIPHGFCLAWDPGLVWLQAGSDALIAAAYYSIPAALLVFLRRRQDLAFKPVFGLFAAFILACGTTHILGFVTLFTPAYWTDGILKAITAALSVATAILLWPLIPKAVQLPSPTALTEVNARLAREIEERDEATARLRTSEQRLRDLYARSPAILHATDAHGLLVEVSQRWLDLFGYTRDQVIGRAMHDFYEPGTMPDIATHLADLMAGSHRPFFERRIVLASGEIRDAEATYALERDEAGRLVRILVAITDVSPRKQAEAALRASEEKLRHAQKMEAVGQLTGGIAHDFNNLLTTIMASMELLQSRGNLDARDSRVTSIAVEGGRRAARLTSQLLSFSRKSHLAPTDLDPGATVRGIEELLSQTLGESIRLRVETSPDETWMIHADRNQLETALLNLVINARDAIAGEGEVCITCTNRRLSPAEAASYGPEPAAAGDYVGIAVTDTGEGMTQETMTRALEPFFTTKAIGEGTGLGLSQTYGFATQSGGTIRLRSQPGAGTEVEILLPRADTTAQPPLAIDAAASMITADGADGAGGAGGAILLAEDDALLRHTVSEVLRTQGYDVQCAADAQSALALLRTMPRVDLLLTDIRMPGAMNGVDLGRAARAILPDLRIIFATGFSDQRILAQWPETLEIIYKPFTLDALLRQIARILQQPAPGAGATAAVLTPREPA